MSLTDIRADADKPSVRTRRQSVHLLSHSGTSRAFRVRGSFVTMVTIYAYVLLTCFFVVLLRLCFELPAFLNCQRIFYNLYSLNVFHNLIN